MSNVKQKKDPTKPDRMFAFKFNDAKEIFQTRGCVEPQNMTKYRIENRLKEIENF